MATPAVWYPSTVPLIPPVTDQTGNILDGEFSGTFPSGDGTAGGDFIATFTLVPPPIRVTAMTPTPNVAIATQPSSILLTFSNALTSGINYKNAVKVTRAGADGVLGTGDDVTITPTSVVLVGTTQLQVNLPAGLPYDKYQVRLPSLPVPISLSSIASTSPQYLTTADLNGDLKPDLLVDNTSPATSNPTVLLGNGTGNFSATTPFSLFGGGLSNVTFADINGDGKPDLIGASNGATNTISVALNTSPSSSTLTFGAVTPFTMGNNCLDVQAIDLNADGKPDLVTANFGDSTISIILNTTPNGATTPTFSAPVTYNVGGSPHYIAFGDINGDGKPDIVVCNYGGSSLSVFLNTTPNLATTPSFAAPQTINTDSQPTVVQCVDLNADGKPDLVVSCTNSNTVNVFMNTTPTNASVSSFGSKIQYSVGTNPVSIAVGDLDGDGKPDFVLACVGANIATVFLNATPALAASPTFVRTDIPTGTGPNSVTLGDLSGSGDVGFATANPSGNSITVVYPFPRAVVDASGNQLDGEFAGTFPSGNGVAGGDFVATFTLGNVGPTTTTVTQPAAIAYGTNSLSLTAAVTATGTTVASGAVTFQLLSGGNNIGSAVLGTVASGSATVTYTLPAGTVPGSYTVSASYNGSGAYQNSTDISKLLTVNTAPLTVTPTNFSRNYGSANPTFTGTISGLKNGDNITATYATTAVAGSPAGPYSITATLSDPGNKLGNYTLTQNTGTLTVNKVALTIAANSASRVYATANPSFTGTITGLVNGDSVTATYATTATTSSAATTYAIVPSPADPGNVLGNYNLTLNNGTLTVTKAPLTVKADSFSRTYGVANPAFTGTLTGVVNGDNITGTYATTATIGTSIGNYSIVPTLVDPGSRLGNYSVTPTNGVLTITTAAGVLVVTPDSFTRFYGDPNPALTGTISGILNGDNITATYSVPATQVSPAANYIISATLLDPGNKLQNYTLNQNVGQLAVSKAPLSVSGGTFTRVYGAANPALSGTIVGIKNGDNITATYATAATATSAVGSYPVVPTTFDPGNKLSSYNLTLTNGALSVTAAPLSVTPANASRAYGSANPNFTGTVTGVLNGDGIGATYATNATVASSVGTYPITASLTDPNTKAGNYTVTLNTGTLTISTAPAITVTPADASRTYGAANPAFNGTLTGILNSDNITAAYATTATPASPVGNYTITAKLVDPNNLLGNYAAVNSNTATLTVGPAALSVTAADAARFYNVPDPVFTGSLVGVQNNDAISALYSANDLQASVVGAYVISPSLVDPNGLLGNYAVTSVDGTLTINPAIPAIAWTQPAPIFAGVPLDSTQFDAAASDAFTNAPLIGKYVYTPAVGTVLAPGLAQSLSVTFTPDDNVNYTTATANVSIDVNTAIPVVITSAATASGQIGTSFTYTITATGSTPITLGASGLPPGLSFNVDTIAGTPTATGVFDAVLTASNYANTVTQTLRIVITNSSGVNHAPVFSSPPASSANPATTGVALTLTASATDADGDALDYTWDFGDGTTALGASVSKTFAAAGVYVVNVVVSDGQASATQSVDLIVEDQMPAGIFTVQKVSIGFNFIKSNSDSLSISGLIPLPPGFNPNGKTARVLIGGLDKSYTLTAKGKSTDKALSLKFKSGASSAAYTFAVKNQALFALLQPLGFSKTQSNPGLSFPVVIVLDGTSYLNQPLINYTVKINKLGPVNGKGKR